MNVEKSFLKETLELVQKIIILLPEDNSQQEFVSNIMHSIMSLSNS